MINWKQVLTFLGILFFSLVGGVKNVLAFSGNETPEKQDTLAQDNCQSSPYAKVTTNGGYLNIRSSPWGKIIGSIPNGWVIETGRVSSNGRWIYIDEPYPYASAPSLTEGWVYASYMKPVGSFCYKPQVTAPLDLPAISQEQPLLVNEDWTSLGDRIAGNLAENSAD